MPDEAKLTKARSTDENISLLVQDNQLKDVVKDEKGSPEAEIIYNVELSKGKEWYDIIWSGSSKITITIPLFKKYWFKFYEINQ